MQRRILFIATAGMVLATLAPAAVAQPDEGLSAHEVAALSAGSQVADKDLSVQPDGPNPYLALLPDPATADYAGWEAFMERQAASSATARERGLTAAAPGDNPGVGRPPGTTTPPLDVDEAEADGVIGENDTIETAEHVDGFGTDKKANNRAGVSGSLAVADLAVEPIAAGTEDDGAIDLATDTGVAAQRDGAVVSAEIGDGPHGSAGTGSGDFDYYSVTAPAGLVLTAAVDTPDSFLDPMVAVWDDSGTLVAFNDDGGPGLDSLATYAVPADGTYHVMVTGWDAMPADPFDSSSGGGAGSEGLFDLTVTVGPRDADVYALDLAEGDVLGALVDGGAGMVSLLDPSGDLVMGSQQDASFIYAPESPLPGGGNALAEHVADESGTHYVMVSDGEGAYHLTVEAYRPGLEKNRPVQTLFLDFDGERINTEIFGGPGVRDLSPFRDFLGDWGLTAADEDAVIDVIVDTVVENVETDLADSGLNKHFDVEVTNSRDDLDAFGDDHVSRVIVGGTIAESGIPTIGIAQTIDPGNYGLEESALVLLDVLGGPSFDSASLNAYITGDSDVIQFVGTAIGNVVSHEAGHFFGNFHVDQFNDTLNLMDQGGNFPLLYGVGDDGVGGTADDPDVDFGEDTFNPGEGFTGTEDTASRLTEVLTK